VQSSQPDFCARHMEKPKRIRILAFSLWLAHCFVILAVSQNQHRILLSDLLQVSIAILAIVACFQAARRSGPFGRIFWRLAGSGFCILICGLALNTYSESFRPTLGRHSWVIDLFVNAWTAPLVMCVFLDPESEPEKTDWRRVLDFAQVAIVFVLLSLYTSNLALPGEGHEPWRLAFSTDILITIGFFLRSTSMPVGPYRTLFLRFGYFRAVSVVTDFFFVLGMPEPLAGQSFDLVWSVTLLIPIMTAAAWSDPGMPALGVRTTRWRLLMTQLLPLIFPLLVVLMATEIVRGQLVIAATAVLISLGITYVRLLLTQREHERSAEALGESHRLLESIMEGANEVVFVKDVQGRYMMINTPGARMISRTVPEVIGKPDEELFPPETAKIIRSTDALIIQTGKPQTYEFTTTLAGVNHTFLSTKSPYFDPQGKIIGLIGFSLDITDRRKLEEQLRQTQKMEAIGTLSGGIAHDFNNLLTVIKGYTGLLLENLKDEESRGLVVRIDHAADRAASLTRQLLAYSRRQVLQPRIISLNSLVSSVDKLLRRLIGEDITMSTVMSSSLASVKADPGQIEQVIMNLAVNARDAMPSGGSLTIETSNVVLDDAYSREHAGTLPGRYVMLAVSDTGVGMDPATKSQIFEPFFTTKRMGRGTGLGLSMVYGIVKQSGGSIEVYSEPQRGTTFKVYLPAVDEPAEDLFGTPMSSSTIPGTETILLVEDDLQVRDLAEAVLNACGYNVLVADSTAAVAQSDRFSDHIDLLLTDVVMPGIGGRELAGHVTSRRPDIKVLYMSGYTTNAIIHHGVLDPGTSFLQKPFTPASLSSKVREVLDGVQPAN
jgi:PAS domain S-box-containing protein